ncbi:MAG TPA: hypothetical protein VFF11_12520 [Candidatus Binatia bacterium]|nr:hypothetical protein [Candidatus Binatia bacterium]
MAAIWREVQDVLAGMKKKRVWVDVTALQTSLDMKNLFDLAKLFWRDFPEGGRMALVVRWDQAGFAKSLEMMVRAVGMHLTAFVTKGRSEAWLEEDTGTQANSGSLNPAKPQLIHNS